MKQSITFTRDHLKLAGDLYLLAEFDRAQQYPAVIVQGSLSSVKEQMPALYAQRFARRGFLALAFDYAHYGASNGEPRQLEDTGEKVRDLHAAVAYLHQQPFVASVSVVGICTSASTLAYFGAENPKVSALATVAASLAGKTDYLQMLGEERFEARQQRGLDAAEHYERTGEVLMAPVYSETDDTAINFNPVPGRYGYYTDPARGNVPPYRNEAAVMGLAHMLTIDPLAQAASISLPTAVIHSEGSTAPETARRFYEALAGPKEIHWGPGHHWDYYETEESIDFAVEQIADFFTRHTS